MTLLNALINYAQCQVDQVQRVLDRLLIDPDMVSAERFYLARLRKRSQQEATIRRELDGALRTNRISQEVYDLFMSQPRVYAFVTNRPEFLSDEPTWFGDFPSLEVALSLCARAR